MNLWLSEDQARTIIRHALDASPREACGLIAGIGSRAERIIPIPNHAADPLHFFGMEQAALVRAMFDIQRAGLALIGIYHSHPRGNAIPSLTDIQRCAYPDTAYLIVGLGRKHPELAAWNIRNGSVERIELYIGLYPPPESDGPPLTQAQKTAIIVGAVVAFAFMIVLSLSLLPPAPIIP